MSITKRFMAAGRSGALAIAEDSPSITGLGVVMPYRLEGEPGEIRLGTLIRSAMLRRIRKLETWPAWTQPVFRVRSASFWAGLRKGFRVNPQGIRLRGGVYVDLSDLPN